MIRGTRAAFALAAAVAAAGIAAFRQVPATAQGTPNAVAIDADDIGGVANGPGGPEAGVWVIA